MRCGHSMDKAVARQAEALLAKDAAALAYLAAADRVAELAVEADALEYALRRMCNKIQKKQEAEAALAPPAAMDIDVSHISSNAQEWTSEQLCFYAAKIGELQRSKASADVALGVLTSPLLPLQVSVATPKKSKVRARSLTPVGHDPVALIEDSPPPGPPEPLLAYGKAAVPSPASSTPYDGPRVGA